jgi:hypothetical protein
MIVKVHYDSGEPMIYDNVESVWTRTDPDKNTGSWGGIRFYSTGRPDRYRSFYRKPRLIEVLKEDRVRNGD